ncbi:MAG: hypothetical protein E6258_06995, partial [Campylobacter ureolyticus]|nr:hypothetical protein [Campylobacter ureolyticus]
MEEILYNKHKEIDECKKFIEFIEKYFLNSNKSASNSNILINLLNQKLKILNSLDYQNCKNLVLSFEKLDDEIYNQIEILKSEIKGDIKNFTYYKQIKYNVDNINKNLKKDKNLSITKIIEEFLVKNEYFEKYIYKKSVKVKREAFFDIFNFIKNHQWISTLLFFAFGFVIYILFFLSQHYIPSISQSEFIYQIIQTSGIFLLIPFFIFLFVFGVMYLYVDYKKNKNYFDCLMSILYIIIFICFILLFILLLICIIYIIFIRGFKIAEIYFVFFIILSIF